jgi:hypothetical protein
MKDFRRPRKIGGGENLRRRLQPFAQNPRLFSGSVVNKARFKIKKKKGKTSEEVLQKRQNSACMCL